MATRLEDVCPKCQSHLIIKEGENGDFLACPRFPACRFTKPLTENYWKDNVLQGVYQKPSPYCERCNHTGLLPFIKNGKLIPYAFVDCECKLNIPEHFDPARLQPEDFDFPMSDTFRGFSYEYCGQVDPGYLPALEQKPIEEREPIIQQKFLYFKNDIRALGLNKRVNELENSNQYLLKKIKELTANASKRKPINTNKLTNIYKGRGGG